MGPCQITNPMALRRVLETFGQLDEIRWQDPASPNLIRYCADRLTDDEKLLTHWLCYIMDRQTPFQRVWDVGGYVLSHIVRAYSRERRDVWELLASYLRRIGAGNGSAIFLECESGPNGRPAPGHGPTSGTVSFASRYMPEDLVLVFRTLALLDLVSDRSLARFLVAVLRGAGASPDTIRTRLASALDGLTYSAIGTISARRLEAEIERAREKATEEAEALTRDPEGHVAHWKGSSAGLSANACGARFATTSRARLPMTCSWGR
jgi:hypothetical protein